MPVISGTDTNAELLEFDAADSGINGEDPGSPLPVGAGTNFHLLEHAYPAPPLNVLYASSVDTEGENPVSRRHGNRTITMTFRCETVAVLDDLEEKVAKLQAEGGTLTRTRIDGSVRIYDIVAADGWDARFDKRYQRTGGVTQVTLTLPAKPYSRGEEVEL